MVGVSSRASRATAEGGCNTATALQFPTPNDKTISFPLRSTGNEWEMVTGIEHGEFGQRKLAATARELLDERDAVKNLLIA